MHLRRSTTTTGRPSGLATPTYRRLLAAQLISLLGTGVTTVAIGLLAFDLADKNAGAILGGILALKMIAYVGLSPVIAAFAHRFNRRRLLIILDLIRGAVLLSLPFITEIWQVVLLMLIVHACAAGFTPAYQATLPEVLPDERDYTQALAFSRLAHDLAELLSPLVAATLLLAMSFHELFVLDGASFVVSAALIASISLPSTTRNVTERNWSRITAGIRAYIHLPELRGLLALNLAVAAASAMTIVNTVVIVRHQFDRGDGAVPIALAAAGGGAAVTALLVPRLLARITEHRLMLTGGCILAVGVTLTAAVPTFGALIALWLALGIGLSLVQTPSGRLINRCATDDTRPLLFAAQFSLSHACWLLTYPIAGVLGSAIGIDTVSLLLGAASTAAVLYAWATWHRAEAPPHNRTPGEN